MQTWGLTDPGNIRQQNQDSYAIVPFGRDRVLMIVCDGMGGAKSGNVASSLAVEVFTGEVRRTQKAGMTPEKAERYSWPQALLAMGLLQAYEQTKDKTALSSVFSYLRRWKNSAGRTLRPVGISGSDWIEFSQQAVRRRTLRGFPRT